MLKGEAKVPGTVSVAPSITVGAAWPVPTDSIMAPAEAAASSASRRKRVEFESSVFTDSPCFFVAPGVERKARRSNAPPYVFEWRETIVMC
jgi:hypothetical protein